MGLIRKEDYIERRESSNLESRIRHIRERKVLDILTSLVHGRKIELLDIGASDCRMSQLIMENYTTVTVTSLDLDLAALASRSCHNMMKVAANAYSLPFMESSFDCIVVVSTFKHLGRPTIAANDWLRVLKQHGHLIIIEPSWWIVKIGGFLRYFEMAYTPNVWTVRRYQMFFQNRGFRYNDGGYFGPFDDSSINRLVPGLYQFTHFIRD